MNTQNLEKTSLVLGRTTHFKGTLGFEGTARISGPLQGEIFSPQATLIVEPEGRVEGKIVVKNAVFKGWVKGEVEAKRQVTIMAGSEVYGIIKSPRLEIESGALFEGISVKTRGLLKGLGGKEEINGGKGK